MQTNQGYISTATNFVPGYGQYKVIGEAILGKNLLTGQSLDVLERLASVNSLAGGFIKLGSLIPESTGTVKPLTNTKKEEVKTITTEDGNTYNVKVNTSNSNNTGSSNGTSMNNVNKLSSKDVNLSDFTQKGGKIDNFAEGIKGKNYNELEKLFDEELVNKLGYSKDALRSGEGIRYRLPNGKSVLLEKGRPSFQDITHQGDYVKIPGTKNGTIRIPLEGNPALK